MTRPQSIKFPKFINVLVSKTSNYMNSATWDQLIVRLEFLVCPPYVRKHVSIPWVQNIHIDHWETQNPCKRFDHTHFTFASTVWYIWCAAAQKMSRPLNLEDASYAELCLMGRCAVNTNRTMFLITYSVTQSMCHNLRYKELRTLQQTRSYPRANNWCAASVNNLSMHVNDSWYEHGCKNAQNQTSFRALFANCSHCSWAAPPL